MKINSIKNISFKGYDAAPLKNLYMLSFVDRGQSNVRRELTKIGEKENFNVAIEFDGNLYAKEETPQKIDGGIYYKWSQDNKVFMNNGVNSYLLTPVNQRRTKYENQLGNILGIETKKSKTIFAGGNIFLGKKQDGEKYILIGEDVIEETAINEHFAEYGFFVNNTQEIDNIKNGKILEDDDSYGIFPTKKEFEERKEEYLERAKSVISDDFDVKKENIFVVPQQEFHIDMFLRPIGYPYILVNSEEKAKELVQNNLGFSEEDSDILSETQRYYSLQKKGKDVINTDEVIEALKLQGFEPIEIGGIFGLDGMANFMNAVVNKHQDGTITYITTSTKCEKEDYSKLEKQFDKQLKEKVPNLKRIYHIHGGRAGQINIMMENLLELSGGLHCLTCEEPNFETWA